MHSGQQHGRDYTPLFKFLLSRVGRDWDAVYSEDHARLDKDEPIHWMVALNEADRQPYFRAGESSYYSGLYVDAENVLRIVDETVTHETMKPSCACCTHTMNGQRFTQSFGW